MSDPLAPGFLIAVPQLADPNFRLSVVLLLQQSEEGALGVVINHESEMLLSELCQDHSIPYSGDPEKKLRAGGPVKQDHGLVLYGAEHEDPEGSEIEGDLHFSASRGTLGRLCTLEQGRFQCYAGYAGWGPGQLEHEIGQGSWIVSAVDSSLIFDAEPGHAWNSSLRQIGIDPAAIVPGGCELA